jgi:hypothetical protein
MDGLMRREVFRTYIEQMLAPNLRPNDVVVLNNLTSHKASGGKEAIRAVGASVLYLHRCGLDLSPIDQLFTKLNAFCAEHRRARTTPTGHPSANSSMPLNQTSATTTSEFADATLFQLQRL